MKLPSAERVRRTVREPLWAATTAAARPTSSLRVLPEFLVIGAQRAGTTSLMQALERHPNIAGPRLMKGVHYFDTAYDRPLDWYRSHFHTAAYARWVEHRTGSPLIAGEASPYYLFHPAVPLRTASVLPDAKLIAMVRNPVERTLSHYRHSVDRGNEPLDVEEALDAESTRLGGTHELLARATPLNSYNHQTFSYVARSEYAPQLERWLVHFDRSRILVIQSETFFSDPEETYRRVLSFLSVPDWAPYLFDKVNPSSSSDVPDHVRQRLEDHFVGPNEDLFELIGERFSWT